MLKDFVGCECPMGVRNPLCDSISVLYLIRVPYPGTYSTNRDRVVPSSLSIAAYFFRARSLRHRSFALRLMFSFFGFSTLRAA